MTTYLEIVRDLANETLERHFGDEDLGGLLVSSDFAERDGSGAEAVGTFESGLF